MVQHFQRFRCVSTNVTPTGSDTLTVTNVIGLNGKWYRVIYTSPLCTTAVPSAAAQLTVNGNVAFSDHPDDITVCSGNDTVFVAAASLPAGQGTFTWGWQYSNDDGATWTTITFPDVLNIFTHSSSGPVNSGTDTLKISDVGSMYNFRFRAMAISAFCETVYSNEARLAIEGPLTVTQQPTGDNVLCSGQGTLFTATINNPGVAGSTIYRWQVFNPFNSTWVDLSNAGPYNGTGTNQLSISNSSGLHGNCYRLSARTSTCNIIYTNEICLTVEGPITVTDQPDNVSLCSGESTFFKSTASVVAGTLAYQWQVSSDNGVNWSNLSDGGVYSGTNTDSLSISDVAGLYNRCYRLRFNTGECIGALMVYSEKACLTVEGPINISNQPDDVTQCSGEPVLFIVGGSIDSLGGTIQYLWQESTDNGNTWNDLDNVFPYNGTKTDTLSISNTVGKDSNLYRVLLWTGECATITSDSARLFIEGPITFTDQPDNVTECSGEGATFQATYANPGTGTVLTQWERSCDNGVTWVNVSNDSIYSGATTTSLNIADVAGLTGCRFRLKAWTATCDTLYSNYAQLTVEGPLDIAPVNQPVSQTVCSGDGTSFSVEVDNGGAGQLSYQWQVSADGTTWFNVLNNSTYNGATSSNLSISNVSGLNGRCYRVNIQTTTCPALTSATACLTVEGPITFTDHPDNVTQCSAESVMFVGAAAIGVGNAGTINYMWQTSSDGINWDTVFDGTLAGYIGSTNDTLIITDVAVLNGRLYRLTARTAECSQVNSNPALLTVEGPVSITNQPPSLVTTCDDKEVIFGATFDNDGQGSFTYQWQQSTDGVTWTDLSNGTSGPNIINGTKTDSLSIAPVTGLDSTLYRLRGWTGTCDTLTTQVILLRVEGPINFTSHPEDTILCSNGAAHFGVVVENVTGIGTIQYQWKVSTNGGVSWSNVTNGGINGYSGATTDTLYIADVTGLGNRKYRCEVRTGSCDWEFSQLATLFVEGPITVSLQPEDAAVCSNIGHIFNTTVTNPGSGVLAFQWQLSEDDGTTWANLNNGPNGVNGGTWQGTKTMDLNISLVEGMDSFMFRLVIKTSTCSDTSAEVLLTVLDACLAGACDNDLDGTDNDNDPDDDNDQLADYWEAWMTDNNIIIATTEFPGTGPWNYQDNNNMLINYDRCVADSDGDGIIDGLEDPDGDLLSNNEETDGDGTLDGNPLDPCHPVLGPTCIGINLAIKVYLQGAMIGNSQSDTLMRDNLRSYGANGTRLIPAEEPYSGILNGANKPFKHKGDGGDEVVEDSTTVFAVTGEDAIVDWVFVEIRSSTALDSVITTRAGLLQRDGDVVDLDGQSHLRFLTAPAGPYYVAVRHRNHLGVMTAEALDLSPIVTEIDFTDTSYLTNGINAQVKLTLNGQPKMALWAGDLNSDGRTIYQGPANDILQLFTTVMTDPNQHPTNKIANFITQGYHRADIDLNGRAIYQGPGNDRAILLFNTTLIFPENDADPDIPGSNPLANYIIFQQLP